MMSTIVWVNKISQTLNCFYSGFKFHLCNFNGSMNETKLLWKNAGKGWEFCKQFHTDSYNLHRWQMMNHGCFLSPRLDFIAKRAAQCWRDHCSIVPQLPWCIQCYTVFKIHHFKSLSSKPNFARTNPLWDASVFPVFLKQLSFGNKRNCIHINAASVLVPWKVLASFVTQGQVV